MLVIFALFRFSFDYITNLFIHFIYRFIKLWTFLKTCVLFTCIYNTHTHTLDYFQSILLMLPHFHHHQIYTCICIVVALFSYSTALCHSILVECYLSVKKNLTDVFTFIFSHCFGLKCHSTLCWTFMLKHFTAIEWRNKREREREREK